MFEDCLLNKFLYKVLRKIDNVEMSVVKANAFHSYHVVAEAAWALKREEQWRDDPIVKPLTFSKHWVKRFFERAGFRRRRVTATFKKRPALAEVQKQMKDIQLEIVRMGLRPADIVNADETGIFFCSGPKYQYVPADARRAAAPGGDDKSRFTAMVWSTAAGELGPLFLIIKCSVSGADASRSTVLDGSHLMAQSGFTESEGWSLHTWIRTLELVNKGKKYSAEFKRPYIRHTSGTVITANSKAWMDTVTMCMWMETQFVPWIEGHPGPKLLVLDNCGPHAADTVADCIRDSHAALTVKYLPPNMTDLLQPMDLYVNAKLKASMRRSRCADLFADMQHWLIGYLEDNDTQFVPHKPTTAEGILSALKASREMTTPEFIGGLQQTFIRVGLCQTAEGEFATLDASCLSELSVCPAPTVRPSLFTLAEVVGAVEVEKPQSLELDNEGDAEMVAIPSESAISTDVSAAHVDRPSSDGAEGGEPEPESIGAGGQAEAHEHRYPTREDRHPPKLVYNPDNDQRPPEEEARQRLRAPTPGANSKSNARSRKRGREVTEQELGRGKRLRVARTVSEAQS
jgi:hypothetical protein